MFAFTSGIAPRRLSLEGAIEDGKTSRNKRNRDNEDNDEDDYSQDDDYDDYEEEERRSLPEGYQIDFEDELVGNNMDGSAGEEEEGGDEDGGDGVEEEQEKQGEEEEEDDGDNNENGDDDENCEPQRKRSRSSQPVYMKVSKCKGFKHYHTAQEKGKGNDIFLFVGVCLLWPLLRSNSKSSSFLW